jgi:hypothetical protein
VTSCNISHHRCPVVPAIDAYFLTQMLGLEYKGWTVGITSADLMTSDKDASFGVLLGGKNNYSDVAVVSTNRLTPKKLASEEGYQLLLSRLKKVTLHEVGHILGLVDHDSMKFSQDGLLCPMSRGNLVLGYHAYVHLIVDGRGTRYCSDCMDFLKRISP